MSVTSIQSSNSATTASNGTASILAAPHRKNAAQPKRSDSPYQGRTAQRDNPTQAIIKQAVVVKVRTAIEAEFAAKQAKAVAKQKKAAPAKAAKPAKAA